MGNLARMLQELGHEISGSDHDLYPPMSDQLADWGMKVYSGFKAANVKGSDLVIIGNAISRGNPEVEEVLNSGMDYISMPEAISKFILKGRKVIVIAGTHGKTTTTFLLHHLLKEAGLSPGLFAGGIRKDGHAGFELGKGEYFVIEGDEYDSAFFDKSSKFLHYRPYILGLTALDFDHADIFSDIGAIQTMFRRLLMITPSKGKIFYNEKASKLSEIAAKFPHSRTEGYSLGKSSSVFSCKKGKLSLQKENQEIPSTLIGEHNAMNSELALRIALEIAPSKKKEFLSGLNSFAGVKRRQDVLYSDERSVLIEDFAHHPAAIQETVKAVKNAYPGFSIVSLFEPRSATSHRNVFQKEFAESFKGSSAAVIAEVFNLKKVPANVRLNVKKLVKDTETLSHVPVSVYAKEAKDIPDILLKKIMKNPSEKIAVLAMSNGSFGGIYSRLKEILEKRK